MSSILIMGSGPSVFEKELGEKIDTAPNIARFQNFKTVGFEKHVGSKCNIWLASGFINLAPQIIKKYCVDQTFYTSMRGSPAHFASFKKVVPGSIRIPRETWVETIKRMGYKRPSTGATCVCYFSKLYDIVYIYGFDYFKSKKLHYYGSTTKHSVHNGNKEELFFKDMIANDNVVVLDGNTEIQM